ncbi:5'-methylthioadenosine/adenosylhomocysteine nucleosidase [Clostridium sp. AF18-27]|uniref:adenosylhomocysteine nucleosidase n=1 Tax=Enterocloster lavalensis TaxID=460384 RepID=A0A1I0JEJ9_9FIRM|nr:5'-methylthioadenosine/adenosylhomocysteine nucleosidase [Enterocloster lavalensis]PST32062.1 5'-methylthioadenosine/adenosylhomocysteine nucleosidase [Enterocloster lavalensis]RHR56102.1 5'-methylthioadenosine/adenosylhomocysteine nucleosidase [Clostridium sp. AF18-27]SEU08553.1 adenosylhomocysteine nucleosidase [Enterocloster lavalensis]
MLGIIGAMDEEVAKIKEMLTDVRVETTAGMDFYIGKLADKDVVVVRSGIGKVNAAMCTQVLADKYHVSGIINSGIAGSLKAQIDIGDIVLSSDALQHDMDATGFGYAVGQIPRVDTLAFAADEALIELAKSCCKDVNPDINTHVGRVVSGDQFISDHGKKEWLVSTFDGYCTEMEGAAIAQASYLNGIPFLIVRAISDKADNSANMDYETFEAQAITHTVNLMTEIIRRY